ncbi:MAG: glycosyltransferase family 1 protein [Chloroflexi bacterium]|nr:glycosyltransferase family 1 protein [Chloroflexota bacterium]
MSENTARRRLPMVAAITAALLIAGAAVIGLNGTDLVNLAGSTDNGSGIARVTVPLTVNVDQPLRLTQFSYMHSAYDLLAVDVEIANTRANPQTAYVWYILAPQNAPEPWAAAVYTANDQRVELAAASTTKITLPGPAADIAAGDYEISVWVHGVDAGGARFHADGAGAGRSLFVGPPYSISVSAVQLNDLAVDEPLNTEVTLAMENNTTAEVEVGVTYSLTPPEVVAAWETAVYNLPPRYLTLLPGESYVITYREALDLPPGDYVLTGWLYRVDAEEQVPVASAAYPDLIQR